MNLHANALVKVKTHYQWPKEVYVLGRRDGLSFYDVACGSKQVRRPCELSLIFPYDKTLVPTIAFQEALVLARRPIQTP